MHQLQLCVRYKVLPSHEYGFANHTNGWNNFWTKILSSARRWNPYDNLFVQKYLIVPELRAKGLLE